MKRIELNIQTFGGRGASYANVTQLKTKEDKIRVKMEKLYKDNSGFAMKDTPEVEKASNEWLKLKRQADFLRSKREVIENRKINAQSNKSNETFVNSYGEATKREITSRTYERAKKRQAKAILRNMGY